MRQLHLYDIFEEREIAAKYFEIIEISEAVPDVRLFRGSLNLARRLRRNYEFANALKWVPAFRSEILDPETYFTDFSALQNSEFPAFIRPVSSFKEFAGDVFTKESFGEHFRFMNTRVDPFLICVKARPVVIGREWRTIFINNEYVSGSQYMRSGELDVSPEVPAEVITYAKKLAANDYFLNVFDFVIDIGETNGMLKLIEVNALETSGFYDADKEKIYKTWSNA